MTSSLSALEKARPIRLLVSDVDGCWTDGHVTLDADGKETVRFNVHDGYGVVQLQKSGVEVALISGRDNPAVAQRAKHLGIKELEMGSLEKAPLIQKLLDARGLRAEQVAAFGDDLPDLALFECAALRCAPASAIKEVREAADFVTNAAGGFGALREVCDLILQAQADELIPPS